MVGNACAFAHKNRTRCRVGTGNIVPAPHDRDLRMDTDRPSCGRHRLIFFI